MDKMKITRGMVLDAYENYMKFKFQCHHTHSFTYYLWLLLCYRTAGLNGCDCYHTALKYCLALCRKCAELRARWRIEQRDEMMRKMINSKH